MVFSIVPTAAWGFAQGRKNRKLSMAAASLLMLFGVNMQITPPPPPATEQVQREAEEDENGASQ